MKLNMRAHGQMFLLALTVIILYLPDAGAQTAQEPVAAVQADSVVIRPFEPTHITEAFNTTNSRLGTAEGVQLSEEDIADYGHEVDTLFSVIDDFLGDSTVITLQRVSIKEMDQISGRADYYKGEIATLQKNYTGKAEALQEVLDGLELNRQRWQLTLDADTEAEMIDTRVERIEKSMYRLDSMHAILISDMQILLGKQDRFSDKLIQLDGVISRVKGAKEEMGQRLFARDQPVIFKDLKNLRDTTLIQEHMDKIRSSVAMDFTLLKQEYRRPMMSILFILLLGLGLALWYHRNLEKQVDTETFKLNKVQLAIVHSPVASIIFAITLLVRFLVPDLPATILAINGTLMMVPLAILVTRIFGRRTTTWTLVLLSTYLLIFLYDLSYVPDIWIRLLQGLISACSLWLFIWLIWKRPFADSFSTNIVFRLFRFLMVGFIALDVIALMANLVGAVQLSEYLTMMPIQITLVAVAIITSVQLVDTIVYLILASKPVQKIHSIREGFENIYKKTVGLLDLFLWLFFFTVVLRSFRVKDAVFEWGSGVLNDGITIGQVEITLANILILIFVIWLSIMITRIVSAVLEKDVFSRVKMAKGVPSTIILLVRIVLISAGFFLAMAAAGMQLTNLSIVLGAFSVGIGFGLQNIFNNMVSGLILAFERPLKVGDVVEVGELLGVVKSIGLRSSTIRTYEGSEVIVPNGNLISDKVTNWTLSDYIKRMDIRVGVAYGTDPDLVIDLLLDVAEKHEKVRKTPRPSGYFLEFGDSSLNFRLLAWVHVDYILSVESELKVGISHALDHAGIEVPFPQRDIHIRNAVEPAKAAPEKPAPKKPAPTKAGSPKKPTKRNSGRGSGD